MEKQQIKDLAEAMTGKNYQYKKHVHKVESHRLTDRVLVLHTDRENITIPLEEIDDFLSAFEPMTSTEATVYHNTMPTSVQTVIGSSAMELKAILLDNIKKVQSNKEYIPQAIEVNNNVKSIIDLAKAEVELMKAMRG